LHNKIDCFSLSFTKKNYPGSGGVKELLDDGIDGLLVEPQSPEELADAIVQVLQNPELALSLSQESRKKIMAKFSHDLRAETLAQCLEKLE